MTIPKTIAATLLAAVSLACPLAHAWGADGHRLVAETAYQQLSVHARTEVDRLLTQEPGSTLASVSTWADEVRSPSTAAWHYANFPRDADCDYDPDRMCVAGSCVVGAIERQTEVLRTAQTDEARLKAMKWLVHLVADAHQPLHAGYSDDRGGNQFQLQAFGRGTNLHAVWDSGLISTWPGGTQALALEVAARATAIRSARGGVSRESPPRAWVMASCRISTGPDFYPDSRKLGANYSNRWSAVLVDQLAEAADHLVGLLDDAMMPTVIEPK